MRSPRFVTGSEHTQLRFAAYRARRPAHDHSRKTGLVGNLPRLQAHVALSSVASMSAAFRGLVQATVPSHL